MPYPMKIFFRRVQVIGVFFTFCPEKFFSRTALISFRIINYLELKDHLQFSWSITPIFSLPGQKSSRRRQKGPGSNLPIFLLLPFRKETRGERDSPATRRTSPHGGKRDHRLFWRGECFFARAWNHLALRKVFYP